MNTPLLPVRAQAALTISSVLRQQASLASLMAPAQQQVAENEQALLQELCFGTLRWQPKLQALLGRLLDKPLKTKDLDIHSLLLLGLYQLLYLRIPDHAAIDTTVKACKALKKPWAEKLVNAVLRNYQRQQVALHHNLASSPAFLTAHPNWLRKRIDAHWPEQAEQIYNANNSHPPFTLRLDLGQVSRQQYLQQLDSAGMTGHPCPYSPYGITLEQPVAVDQVPGFAQGRVSVQDEAAQLAADLLQLQPGQRVLDACCAPGGKTGHILELARQLQPTLTELVALELEPRRLLKVEENLQRLRQPEQPLAPLQLLCADALQVEQWWDQQPFDRILLDAPCSATGVIRRHPDIKVLRKATDIAKLAELQLALLHALWLTLRPGGRLIYATCSILPTENTAVVEQFLSQCATARHQPLQVDWGLAQTCGRQLLPSAQGNDGFYYACLIKAD
ncbi:MAG: 16S rRNA (cytosine(967)-C(5))-methyltransferase RsmB [Gammaproteobacteria bacterium]|uniref:16S rRNA (cytosine(967)-C(5))-methyltransferase RsmB n=1 Tax=Pseudomaricurvus alcaniphilus TaxID=1166482 RepID=UPI00140A6F22|nr:16S rRNA (cytosine(967)-C(5))-methyltransferase RsmB [Pseudomaricurvus alcaniphilus]MBR9912633.1 16S rRNA (cytosine(967)-C(5))-methyltransferase RsmB [Gammaproteobacteria bacterium]NHN38816.1 16S rRNA (cytosine(967)-C(5))-methyltransferase RsmB [Pseudomaricurvus alcaniphilus]